jgi:DNA-binding NtrC family response regulator/pSer/pThr/pTyr-binding forkhead associated (FHA) protein
MTRLRSQGFATFRLRGEVGGRTVKLSLAQGDNRIGSHPDNEIVIAEPYISRHHAVLRIASARVAVEDLGSRNGTFVNGDRVTTADLAAGDRLHLGPLVLQLETMDSGDTRLAIQLGGPAAARAPDPTAALFESTRPATPRSGSVYWRWVEVANRLTALLAGEQGPAGAAALAEVTAGLGARGACLVSWAGRGEPVVVHASGTPDVLRMVPALRDRIREAVGASRGASTIRTFFDHGPPFLAGAVAFGPVTPTMALIIDGDFPSARSAAPILELALRLLVHAHVAHAATAPRRDAVQPPALIIPDGFMVGTSAAIWTVYEEMRHLLAGDYPVLVTGETGVGKEHIARILHASSNRAGGPFVAVNCAAIPADLVEAELFGIESGVATGVTARKGKFQLSNGGTLFLDEIGEMPLAFQAKLLRALQSDEIHPVGAAAPLHLDTRVVASTNRDLEALVAEKRFRRDLFYRIAACTLVVPALRSRRDDIAAFVEHFVARLANEAGKSIAGVTVKALDALAAAHWPGNVRQLEHEMRRLVRACPAGQAIDSEMLSNEVLSAAGGGDAEENCPDRNMDLAAHTEQLERRLITIALARAKGNKAAAARLLGITRNGLMLKLERLAIE